MQDSSRSPLLHWVLFLPLSGLALSACLPYATPPAKVALEGGGAIGQRIAISDGEQHQLEGGPLLRVRAGLDPLHLFPQLLDRRYDLSAGYLGEFQLAHDGNPHAGSHGAFLEVSWHPLVLALGRQRGSGAAPADEALLDAEERAYLEQGAAPSTARAEGATPDTAGAPSAASQASPPLLTTVLRLGLSVSGEVLFDEGISGTETGGGGTVALNLELAHFSVSSCGTASRDSLNLGVGVGEGSVGLQVSGSYRTFHGQPYGVVTAGILVRVPYLLGVVFLLPGISDKQELP